jgi:hypothetical protein
MFFFPVKDYSLGEVCPIMHRQVRIRSRARRNGGSNPALLIHVVIVIEHCPHQHSDNDLDIRNPIVRAGGSISSDEDSS